MNKKVKLSADKAKQLAEKIRKYENLNASVKNILGGVGEGTSNPMFSRLSGYVGEDPKSL